MECRVLRVAVYSLLERADRGTIGTLIVISPAQGIGRAGKIRQPATSCLSERERHIEVSAVLQHRIGEIIGGDGIIGLHSERLLILVLGFLPLSLAIEKASEQNIEANIFRILLYAAFLIGNGLID